MENLTIDSEPTNDNGLAGYVRAFLWLLLGLFALVKAAQLLDHYFIAGLMGSCKPRSKEQMWLQYQAMKEQTDAQLQELRQRNTKLVGLVADLQECNRQLINENCSPQSAMGDQQMDQGPKYPHNLFIKNNHFHLTNQVFVKKGRFDLNIENPSAAPKVEPSIWMKYLKQRKSLMSCQSIVDPNAMIESTPGRTEPPILSTEEMQKIQGIN
ncbi:uncharacterized protein [Drosophila pseudoobscura]|uniref:Uncharacterized protein n=1 Tax=Drosophila pseudoobscura pseudoobscura TaxID=46245 RepID=A0A6I8UWG1_DROPS|nr:uncharacterized protein LOC4805567 [Drosophila pseudoobscura]